MMNKFVTYSVLFLLFSSANISAQSFGFGCLGLVNGYAGYSYQAYQPTGLNSYVDAFNEMKQDSLQGPLQHFGKGKGFRIGVNFFRANLKGFVITGKGFYQLLKEKTNASVLSGSGITNTSFELSIKSIAIGFDVGIDITKSLTWKAIDASILFNNAEFKSTVNYPYGITTVTNYNTAKGKIGYSIGTGFIFDLIDDYVSIEGLAGYTFFSIDNVQLNENTYLPKQTNTSEPMNNFITAGGFNAVIQLNIGFPL